jgi:predicted secreted protein
MTDRAILEKLLSDLDAAMRRPGMPLHLSRRIEDAMADAEDEMQKADAALFTAARQAISGSAQA